MSTRTGQILLHGKVWVKHVSVAETTWQRMRGLLGTRDLRPGHGLLIEACGSIHTVGMRYAIDVIFIDRAWRVRRVCRRVRPGWPVVWGGWSGLCALEVASGWLAVKEIAPGTQLEWRGESEQ